MIPGEDARAYRGRLKAWTGSLKPRNPVELYLVERAVTLSWQLDRADRAQLERLSRPEALAPTGDANDGSASDRPPASDDIEAGERLRRYQLGWGRALSRTLQTLAMIRELDEANELTIPFDPADTLRDSAPCPPHEADEPSPSVGEFEVTDEHLAALTMILATIEPANPLAAGNLTTACEPEFAGHHPQRHPEDSADERESTRRPTQPSHRRGPGLGDRRAEWSPARKPAADADARCRPVCRSRPRQEAPSAPLDGRRRVGGYEVPLDCSTPVSCADRIPVRLRREAAARR